MDSRSHYLDLNNLAPVYISEHPHDHLSHSPYDMFDVGFIKSYESLSCIRSFVQDCPPAGQ